MRVYLAGKMGGRMGYDVLNERVQATELCIKYRLDPIDPARGEYIEPTKPVDLSMNHTMMQSFVAKDEYAISKCGVLLILTGDTPSEGTGLEFGLALKLGIPVVIVSPKRAKGELMGFWNIKASAVFATQEEAIKFIADNYRRVGNAIY